jgi:hypothetical protein
MRDLLASVSPLPWSLQWYKRSDIPDAQPYVSGVLGADQSYIASDLAEWHDADGVLVVAAVNEYEAHLDIEDAFRAWAKFSVDQGLDPHGALALLDRLDAVRLLAERDERD